jgi:hypothetical protein
LPTTAGLLATRLPESHVAQQIRTLRLARDTMRVVIAKAPGPADEDRAMAARIDEELATWEKVRQDQAAVHDRTVDLVCLR